MCYYIQQPMREKPQPLISVKNGEIQLKTLRQAEGFGLINYIDKSCFDEGGDYNNFLEEIRQCETFEQLELCHICYNNGNLEEYYHELSELFSYYKNTYLELKCLVKALLISYRDVLWHENIPKRSFKYVHLALQFHGYHHEAKRLEDYHKRIVSQTW